MSGSVQVRMDGKLIIATWRGDIDGDILDQGTRQIAAQAEGLQDARILHDTLAMTDPPMALALRMRAFNLEIGPRVRGIATVVESGKTAFMSKIAFAFAKDHQVFRRDLAGARAWLESL